MKKTRRMNPLTTPPRINLAEDGHDVASVLLLVAFNNMSGDFLLVVPL
jgi:hypothetical protein